MHDSKYSHEELHILEQAADWLLLIEEQSLTQEQQQQFEQWKNTSPRHQKIWLHAEKVRNRLQGHTQNIPAPLAKQVLTQDQSLPWANKLMLLLTGSTIIGFTIYMTQQHAWFADHRTAYAEQQNIILEDGTKITLNSKTAIDVNYTANNREIILRFGEVYIETGKDPAHRPFKILNQHGEMLALGTAFNVWQQKEQTILMVMEHAVQVTTDHSKQKQTIQSGQQISFNTQQISPTQPIQLEQLSWLKGLVTVNRITLKELAIILERNYGVSVHINHELLQHTQHQIEISGSFPINNLDRMIELLENTYPIQIEKNFLGHKLTISAQN